MGSLTVIGTGIKSIAHMTHEARICIEKCDRLFYLVNEPVMETWLKKYRPDAETLEPLYWQFRFRQICYKAITKKIISSLGQSQNVGVIIYGHPLLLARPLADACLQAKQQGYIVTALPAVSSLGCLFADLLIDPGECGFQVFEATDFVLYGREWDPSSHLILLQIGFVGVLTNNFNEKNKEGIDLVLNRLSSKCGKKHVVTIYEASQLPHFSPRIEKIPLERLPTSDLNTLSTLYVPPIQVKPMIKKVRDSLKLL